MQNDLPPEKGWKPTRAEVFEFLQSVPIGVISTLNESGHPQAATVGFSQTKDLEFLIGTNKTSRKAQNIERDSRVAFVATEPAQRFTVQLEGTARKLTAEEFDKYEDAHFEKLPASARFRDAKSECYILITPHWLRFSDCNVYPWVTTEFTFEKVQS